MGLSNAQTMNDLLKLIPYTVRRVNLLRRQIVYEDTTVIMTLDGPCPNPSAEQYADVLNGAHRAGVAKTLASSPLIS